MPPRVVSDVDLAIIGGGIVGLATARAFLLAHPGATVVVLEKEPSIGQHQTGRNSGVVHAGVYYPPGSLKAQLCSTGRARLEAYTAERGLPFQRCGKLIVATTPIEAERLTGLFHRAVSNGVPAPRLLDEQEMREVEPAVRGLAALHSPATAITDFNAIAGAYADDVCHAGGKVLTAFPVAGFDQNADAVTVTAEDGRAVRAGQVALCAGLWSDRLARLAGDEFDPAIVPFRGDYFRVVGEQANLVRGLVYPVPDPQYPFLGVHLTRTIRGELLVGPNAVLAPAREGYRLSGLRPAELLEVARCPGFRRLARQHWRVGATEMWRSMSRRAFARAAQRYVPALRATALQRAPAGVRAQAIDRSGALVDDFVINRIGRVVAVRNAPSPAATSSLPLGEEIARHLAAL